MKFFRRTWLRYLLLALVLLALAVAGSIFFGMPHLLEVSPLNGTSDVASNQPLRLVFSRAMDPESIRQHLQLSPAVDGDYHWEGQTLVFAPAKAWPSGATIQVRLEPGAQAANFPALPLRQGWSGSFTVWQARLAYLYPSDGPANVLFYEPHTGSSVALTNAFLGVLDYVVLPDGSALYYSTPLSTGGSEIMHLPVASRQPVTVTPTTEATAAPIAPPQPEPVQVCAQANCRTIAISPHRDYLAYERTVLPGGEGPAVPQVWFVPLEPATGLSAGSPVLAGAAEHQTLEPLWSPDNRLTFYDSTASAFMVLDPANGKTISFPNQTGQVGDWRPDGSAFLTPEIFFLDPGTSSTVSGLERLSDSHLLLYDPRSGQSRDLTQEDGIEDASPAYSPDGAYLAFARKYLDTRRWTLGRQVWLMDLKTNKARPVTADAIYNHYDLKWSPAGDQLAFTRFNQSTLKDPPEVWILDLTSGELQKIVMGGYAPQWIP